MWRYYTFIPLSWFCLVDSHNPTSFLVLSLDLFVRVLATTLLDVSSASFSILYISEVIKSLEKCLFGL